MQLRLAIVILGLSAVGLGTAATTAQAATVLVSNHGLTVRASGGSGCAQIEPEPGATVTATVCGDAGYPLSVNGRLPVKPKDRLFLRFRDDPTIVDDVKRVFVGLVDVDGLEFDFLSWDAQAKRIGGKHVKWRVRLPSDLNQADVLDISVDYPGGDSNAWAGLKPTSP